MTQRLRVGVVGGRIGAQHIDAYKMLPEQYEVRAFCDIAPAMREEVGQKYQIPVLLGSLEELLARDDIDIVDLCTPSGLHFAQTSAALRAGKHVVCEKPIAGNLAEVDQLIALEAQSGKRVCPIFQYRFGHGFQRFLHLKRAGVLGKPYLATIETHWRRTAEYYAVPWRGKWRTELGGCLVTHAIHAHDMLVTALGPISTVFARTATLANTIETEDCAVLSLEMASGALVGLSVTLGAAKSEISRLRFCFEHATIESNHASYRPHTDPWVVEPVDEAAAKRLDEAEVSFVPGNEHFAGQFDLLHKALTKGSPLPVELADSRTSLELLTAAYHSSQTGTMVRMPLGADHAFYKSWWPENAHG